MATITGNALDNVLKGTLYGDIMQGRGGDDTLIDRTGNFIPSDDFMFGGRGDDWLQSVSGNDRLFGGLGDDAFQVTLNCDPHNEGFNRIIRGGSGLDELTLVDPQNIASVSVEDNHIEIYDKAGGITTVYGVEHYSFDF